MEPTLFFISENTSTLSPGSLEIVEESRNSDGYVNKFRANPLLQDGKVNGNKRLYEREILEEITKQCKNRLKRGTLFMEMDHPLYNGDDKKFKARALRTPIENCGAKILDIYLESGNDVIGVIESLDARDTKGYAFTDLVLRNDVDFGFSLRMLGGVKPHPTMEGVTIPTKPLQFVTYDIVSDPSHSRSSIINFLTEETHKYLGAIDTLNNTVLTESTRQENSLKDHLQLPDTSEEIIKNFSYQLINQKIFECEGNLKFNF